MAPESAHIFLFTNTGTLRPTSAEEARVLHNATVGDPAGVAAAQSLGNLSHQVYVPMGDWSGEIMFITQWTSAEGIQQFFSDTNVQESGARLFTASDAAVWRPAEGFLHYWITTPLGQHDRVLAVVRSPVTSLETAQRAMNRVWRQRVNEAHKLGLIAHEMFVRHAPPGTPEALEILGIDTWSRPDGLRHIYQDPAFEASFEGVFSAPPKSWVLRRPAGEWIEW